MTIHIMVRGKVQGVFYRATASREAEESGITGWVKNRDDAAVEITATGSKEALEKFTGWCRTGPAGAFVTHVEVKEIHEQTFSGFSIIRK